MFSIGMFDEIAKATNYCLSNKGVCITCNKFGSVPK